MNALTIHPVRLIAFIGIATLSFVAAVSAAEPELKRVMLSSGGVGYFEYEAEIDNDAQLELDVRLDQVDDVLKSIVIYDDKGGVGSFRLQSEASMDEIFRDLPFGPKALTSMDRMLDAMKGTEIQVSGPRPMTGRIVSVVEESESIGDLATTTRHRVGVMTDTGLQHFILEDTKAVKFTDADLNERVMTALEKAAAQSGQDSRKLLITSKGDEKRTLTIGYVVEAPLWKASYRLLLPQEDLSKPLSDIETKDNNKKARLQGWAVVDNASGQDWSGIELTLTSGNPVTFRQALYATYYLNRPNVPLEVMGNVLPSPDEGGIARGRLQARTEADGYGAEEQAYLYAPSKAMPPSPEPMADMAVAGAAAPEMLLEARNAANQQTQSAEAFAHIEFSFKHPVTVDAGQSLVVPIIDRNVPAERIHVHDPSQTQSAGLEHRPFAAVRLHNDSDTSLPPGALTLYDVTDKGTVFVGDARIKTLPKGDHRFISYALDEKTFVDKQYRNKPDTVTLAKLSNGVLQRGVIDNFIYNYTLKAPENERRRLVLVIPDTNAEFDNSEKFVYEKTKHAHRVQVDLDPGETREVKLNFLRKRFQSTRFINYSLKEMGLLFDNVDLDNSMRQTVEDIMSLKRTIDGADTAIRNAERKVDAVFREQERIRENIKALDKSSSIYQRYLRKLDAQEDELEAESKTIDAETAKRDKASAELQTLISNLSFEIKDGKLVRVKDKT